MKNEEFNYDEDFNIAKLNTIHSHAIVWVREVLESKKTDKARFEEIKRIVDEATKHLNK